MSTHDILGWSDDVCMKMAQVFDAYSKERDENVRDFYLSELSVGVTGLAAIIEELRKRDNPVY